MARLVLDPSVVIKWYVPEVLTDAAVSLKRRIHEESWPVAVPQLFFVESANVLWKKTSLKKELSRREGEAILSGIMGLPFYVVEDREVLPRAMRLASEYSISVYDALYLACAIRFKSVLVTADSALTRNIANSNLRKHIAFLAGF